MPPGARPMASCGTRMRARGCPLDCGVSNRREDVRVFGAWGTKDNFAQWSVCVCERYPWVADASASPGNTAPCWYRGERTSRYLMFVRCSRRENSIPRNMETTNRNLHSTHSLIRSVVLVTGQEKTDRFSRRGWDHVETRAIEDDDGEVNRAIAVSAIFAGAHFAL